MHEMYAGECVSFRLSAVWGRGMHACMQAPWKPSGYLQDCPVESSKMRAVVPTILCESDGMRPRERRSLATMRYVVLEALALLWRRLRLGSASGVVCAAAHDHVGGSRLPGDHCREGCEGLGGGQSAYNVQRGSARRNASRTRVDSPVARAAMYRGWANRQPMWDKQAQGDCADGRLARVG